jgi:cytochrome P450
MPVDQARLMQALSVLRQQGAQDFADVLQDVLSRVRPQLEGMADAREAPAVGGAGVARTFSEITLTSTDVINEVYLNAAGNYSVAGYNTRLEKSFGHIYLGMDKGAEYDRQATVPNEAIGRITTPAAFALTLGIARRAVAASSPYPPDAKALEEILNKTLAELCSHWFGLPDGVVMVMGRMRQSDITAPARCPGDFSFTSASVFKPKPDCMVSMAGQAMGQLLKGAVTQFIAKHRAAGTVPTAELSRAIFEEFPNDDDLIGRTIIGVMMGFLPTTYFNLFFAVLEWRTTGMFATLQQRLKENNEPAFERALAVLREPLMQAMQRKPMPDAVWRTAARAHTLGGVQVNPGDLIHIDIMKATQADQQAGTTDVFPIFGGNRNATPHPQHACPGYALAMGVMLATVNALLEPVAP